MSYFRTASCLVISVLTMFAAGESHAAEIRLKRECQPQGRVITLGGIAEVFSSNAEEQARLQALEIAPAPAPGTQRFVRIREVQDLLDARGVNLASLSFSGASVVTITSNPDAGRIVSAAAFVPTSRLKQASGGVREAIIERLRGVASPESPWQVELAFSEDELHQLAAARSPFVVTGGEAPWVGEQQFDIAFETASGKAKLRTTAQVAISEAVVVAARSLPAGAVVRADDLRLEAARPVQHENFRNTQGRAFRNLDEVVGLETTRAVGVGQTIDTQTVRRPLLVRQNDVVTVYARAAGLQVRTHARARESGSDNDLITVESLETREKFFARVTGIQVVEVYARAMNAAGGAK